MTTIKDLTAQQAKTKRDFEAARFEAERIANSESDALSSDEAYIAWTRQKKLAEREVARLEAVLTSVADEIEAESGRQQRDALQRRYLAVKDRNSELLKRLEIFADDVLPAVLELLKDLAQDQIDVSAINPLVPGQQQLVPADHAMRSIPAVQKTATRNFSPAQDIAPLWKTMVLPRAGWRGAPIAYDGEQAYSPQSAIELLTDALGQPRKRIFPPADTLRWAVPG